MYLRFVTNDMDIPTLGISIWLLLFTSMELVENTHIKEET